MEKVLKGLECCCQMNGNVCRTECPYSDECIENECVGTAHLCANALELLKEQQEIINELNTAIKEWRDLKWFTPYEVGIAMVTHGQKDPQFKWGETIKYSPADVEKILNEVGQNEN